MSRKPLSSLPPPALDRLIAQSYAPDNNQGHFISLPSLRPHELVLPFCKRCHLNLWLLECTSVGCKVAQRPVIIRCRVRIAALPLDIVPSLAGSFFVCPSRAILEDAHIEGPFSPFPFRRLALLCAG